MTLRVLVWLVEGTWEAAVDTARARLPSDSAWTLLHVTPAEIEEAGGGAFTGLLGRSSRGRNPAPRMAAAAEQAAGALLDEAAERLGRPAARVARTGNVERVVVEACRDADMLVAARDGDRSRLGPRSLGRASRFVVDHAPCAVLLVWPGQVPGLESIPPPPPGGARPPTPPA